VLFLQPDDFVGNAWSELTIFVDPAYRITDSTKPNPMSSELMDP